MALKYIFILAYSTKSIYAVDAICLIYVASSAKGLTESDFGSAELLFELIEPLFEPCFCGNPLLCFSHNNKGRELSVKINTARHELAVLKIVKFLGIVFYDRVNERQITICSCNVERFVVNYQQRQRHRKSPRAGNPRAF